MESNARVPPSAPLASKEAVLIDVASGSANIADLRQFIRLAQAKKAAISVYICFADEITAAMESGATKEGYYDQEQWGERFPKIQLLSIEEMLQGKTAMMPKSLRSAIKKTVRKERLR